MRLKRHARVRTNLSGTAEKPRLNVYRSNKHIYAQIIDDNKGVTLAQASSKDSDIATTATKVELATKVGEAIAKKLLTKALKKSYLTVEDIYITDVLKHWLKQQEKAD